MWKVKAIRPLPVSRYHHPGCACVKKFASPQAIQRFFFQEALTALQSRWLRLPTNGKVEGKPAGCFDELSIFDSNFWHVSRFSRQFLYDTSNPGPTTINMLFTPSVLLQCVSPIMQWVQAQKIARCFDEFSIFDPSFRHVSGFSGQFLYDTSNPGLTTINMLFTPSVLLQCISHYHAVDAGTNRLLVKRNVQGGTVWFCIVHTGCTYCHRV